MISSALVVAVFGLGGPELLLILAVVLLLFGAKKLPELAKGLGRSVKEFKKATNEAEEDDAPKPVAPPTAAATPVAEAKKAESGRTHGAN
jgi:sec-independent protein translocase protein TatA